VEEVLARWPCSTPLDARTGGLGECYAKLLASRGASIVINDITDRCHATAEAIRQASGDAMAVQGSVAHEGDVKKLVDATIEKYGKVSGVLSAFRCDLRRHEVHGCTRQRRASPIAILPRNAPGQSKGLHGCALVSRPSSHQRLERVCSFGTVNLIRAVHPHMAKAKYGRILNITSSTVYGMEDWSYYGAAKAAIQTLTRGLALEMKDDGILLNAMAPTGLTQAMMAGVKHKEILELDQVKAAKPELAAPMAAYLLHPSCTCTGRSFFSGAGNIASMTMGSTKGITDAGMSIEKAAEAVESGSIDRDYKQHASTLDQMAHN
jgi:NAD(P)-dependent dehydrogenase (short-subunit alcohol dehydrogenase family)